MRLPLLIAALAVFAVPVAKAEPLDDFLKCAQVGAAEARLACYDKVAAGAKTAAAATTAPATITEAASEPRVASVPEAALPPAPASAPAPKKKSGWFGGWFGGKKEAPPATTTTTTTTTTMASNEAPASAPAPSAAPTPEAQFGAERVPKAEEERVKEERVDEIHVAVDQWAFTPFGKIIVFLNNGQVWQQLDADRTRFRLRQNQKYTAKVSRGVLRSYQLSFEGVSGTAKVTRIK